MSACMRAYLRCMHFPACVGACVLPLHACCLRTICTALLHEYMNVCAYPTYLPGVREKMLVVAGTCGHVNACGLLGWCAHALLSMWVHAYFFRAIYKECWALISFGDICVPPCHCFCGYTLTIPPPHTLPYYPRTQRPPCPLPQARPLRGVSPSGTWARGGDT